MFVGVTGHQDIPEVAVSFVRKEVTQALESFAAGFTAVTSLAKGADQIFAEIAIRQKGRLYVIVPCQNYEMAFEDDETLKRYQRFLTVADTVETLNHSGPSEEAFLDAGKRVADLSQLLIAIWDGRQAKGEGGTADIVEYGRTNGKSLLVIWPPGINR